MSSILEMVRARLDDASIDTIGGQIGQDRRTTTEAIDSALPMLVGALSRSAHKDGAAGLNRALDRKHDGSVLNDVAAYVGSGDRSDGDGILGHVLGSHRDAAAKMLGASSGIDRDQASSLMATLAPLILGAVGKAKRESKLGAGDLTHMLSSEEQDLKRRAPNMMSAVWGLLDTDGDGDTDLADLVQHGKKGLGKFFRR